MVKSEPVNIVKRTKPLQIHSSISGLEITVEDLTKQIKALENRLTYICITQETETCDVEVADDTVYVPLAKRILNVKRNINCLINRINYILENIQI